MKSKENELIKSVSRHFGIPAYMLLGRFKKTVKTLKELQELETGFIYSGTCAIDKEGNAINGNLLGKVIEVEKIECKYYDFSDDEGTEYKEEWFR